MVLRRGNVSSTLFYPKKIGKTFLGDWKASRRGRGADGDNKCGLLVVSLGLIAVTVGFLSLWTYCLENLICMIADSCGVNMNRELHPS